MERTFKKTAEDTYPQKIFAHQLITIDDLQQFKKQLLEELLLALKKQTGVVPKKWLKSQELRRLFKISPGTLQTLKSSGIIPYTKIGGVHFYDYDDIQKALGSRKSEYEPGIKTLSLSKNFLLKKCLMTCAEANQINFVDYLYSLGIQPQKIRNNDYQYLSPLRDEKTPSFKINRRLNACHDFGLGQGGNIIDFGLLYRRCNVLELLKKIPEIFPFHQQILTVQQPPANTQNAKLEALEPTIKVIAARALTHPLLCRYLDERKILFEIAKKYCKEVDFELNGKQYFAIGFENKSGGFELRNKLFKGSTSPKDVTKISFSNAKDVAVFEGFFNFLSYQTLNKNNAPLTNFLVLNSLSFFEKSRLIMEQHPKIDLYLDRDQAGLEQTQNALKWNVKYTDRSHLYKTHKDLNDYLVHQNQQQKHVQRLRRHL